MILMTHQASDTSASEFASSRHGIDRTPTTAASYSRRTMLAQSGRGLCTVALAGMPFALGVATRMASGQSNTNTATLTLLLKVALLQQAFYTHATQPTALTALDFTSDELAAVTAILAHETAHVTLLSTMVQATAPAGGYDFTAGSGTHAGPYSPFTSKADFYAIAVHLEDLGVRVHLGVLGSLMGDPQVTTIAQLHSTQARHAAQVRRLQGDITTEPYMPTSWDNTTGTLDHAVYGPGTAVVDENGNASPSTGEDNRIEATSYFPHGIDTYDGTPFDEPLSATNVLAATVLFGVS